MIVREAMGNGREPVSTFLGGACGNIFFCGGLAERSPGFAD